jgi:type II secretory pathway pseudopilin PulG
MVARGRKRFTQNRRLPISLGVIFTRRVTEFTPMRRIIDHRRAFTLLELIVIMTIICILVAIMIPANIKARDKARRISCVGRLKNIGLAYRIFATDHGDRFPWQLATNAPPAKTFDEFLRHYRTVSNELATPILLVCPADTRKAATNWATLSRMNISYFTSPDSAETFPQSFLAGDRNLTTNGVRIGPGIVNLASQTNVAWDGTIHRFQGNTAMGDGSVQQLSTARMVEQMQNTGLNSMTLAVP